MHQPPQGKTLVIAPHQDDESLGCGGIITLKRQMGVDVDVLFLTDGAEDSRTHKVNLLPEQLENVRRAEALSALVAMGVDKNSCHFLRLLNGHLPRSSQPSFGHATKQITKLFHLIRPEEVFVTSWRDRHLDHVAAFELIKEVIRRNIEEERTKIRLFQYPIWFWSKQPFRPIKLRGFRLCIQSVLDIKKKAIKQYVSQTTTMFGRKTPALSRWFLREFFGSYEVFFEDD